MSARAAAPPELRPAGPSSRHRVAALLVGEGLGEWDLSRGLWIEALHGEQLAGVVGGRVLGDDEAEVLTLAVVPALRRHGVGRALVDALLARFGDRRVHLEVRAGNAAALALYRDRGFVEAGRRTGYYGDGEDAVLLTRPGGDD